MTFANLLYQMLSIRNPVVIIVTPHDCAQLRSVTTAREWAVTHSGTFFNGVPVVQSREIRDSYLIAADDHVAGITVHQI